jgi:hypothetical protein
MFHAFLTGLQICTEGQGQNHEKAHLHTCHKQATYQISNISYLVLIMVGRTNGRTRQSDYYRAPAS